MAQAQIIDSIVSSAAGLYKTGVGIKDAVARAMNQYRVTADDVERKAIFSEVCRRLSQRSAAVRRNNALIKRSPQMRFHFPPRHKV